MMPFDGYEAALAELDPPLAFVDLDALGRNLGRLVAVAAGSGKRVRLATKSIRCLDVTRRRSPRGRRCVAC